MTVSGEVLSTLILEVMKVGPGMTSHLGARRRPVHLDTRESLARHLHWVLPGSSLLLLVFRVVSAGYAWRCFCVRERQRQKVNRSDEACNKERASPCSTVAPV
jgi:hypothetical protein